MKIAIVGTGNVGGALAQQLIKLLGFELLTEKFVLIWVTLLSSRATGEILLLKLFGDKTFLDKLTLI